MHFYIQVLNDSFLQLLPSDPLCWQWLQHQFHYLDYVLRRIMSKIEVDRIGILPEELSDLLAVYSSVAFLTEGQPPKYHLVESDPKRPNISRISRPLSLITDMHFRGKIVESAKGSDLVPRHLGIV